MIGLFIYLFFRTEKTVINELVINIISLENYLNIKKWILAHIVLNNHIIYSLPEGLWVFCISVTSKNLFIRVRDLTIQCIYIPLVFAIGLELFQLVHITKGRFDIWDILFSLLFWLVANYLLKYSSEKQHIIKPFNQRSMICILSYAIVYLAHVWE
ncbi:hypothetical protein GCM10022393_13340 [Aquimarina addita]|uniref:VanZ-like domain-containing protein n=1 Tax=Aquimarina addita TaxID=870485 RepID=A0ABP7XEY3_9FLAO